MWCGVLDLYAPLTFLHFGATPALPDPAPEVSGASTMYSKDPYKPVKKVNTGKCCSNTLFTSGAGLPPGSNSQDQLEGCLPSAACSSNAKNIFFLYKKQILFLHKKKKKKKILVLYTKKLFVLAREEEEEEEELVHVQEEDVLLVNEE